MNRQELRAQIQDAANRLTDELVEYFGQMLQSVVRDVTVGVGEVKPLRKASPPATPAKAAPKKASSTKRAPSKRASTPSKAPKKAPAKRSTAAKAKPAKEAATSKRSGRRSVKELDNAAERVHRFLKREGRGMRIEEINKALGTNTRELMRPIKKLLADKKIERRGERRSTTYFAS